MAADLPVGCLTEIFAWKYLEQYMVSVWPWLSNWLGNVKWSSNILKFYDDKHCLFDEVIIIVTIFYICRRRIFILGPSHHERLSGCALSGTERYQTPLGDLNIDLQGWLLFLLLISLGHRNKTNFPS